MYCQREQDRLRMAIWTSCLSTMHWSAVTAEKEYGSQWKSFSMKANSSLSVSVIMELVSVRGNFLKQLPSVAFLITPIGHVEEMNLYAKHRPPAFNQLELHPWLQQREVVEYCHKHGIVVEAYCPLVRNKKTNDPTLNEILPNMTKPQHRF